MSTFIWLHVFTTSQTNFVICTSCLKSPWRCRVVFCNSAITKLVVRHCTHVDTDYDNVSVLSRNSILDQRSPKYISSQYENPDTRCLHAGDVRLRLYCAHDDSGSLSWKDDLRRVLQRKFLHLVIPILAMHVQRRCVFMQNKKCKTKSWSSEFHHNISVIPWTGTDGLHLTHRYTHEWWRVQWVNHGKSARSDKWNYLLDTGLGRVPRFIWCKSGPARCSPQTELDLQNFAYKNFTFCSHFVSKLELLCTHQGQVLFGTHPVVRSQSCIRWKKVRTCWLAQNIFLHRMNWESLRTSNPVSTDAFKCKKERVMLAEDALSKQVNRSLLNLGEWIPKSHWKWHQCNHERRPLHKAVDTKLSEGTLSETWTNEPELWSGFSGWRCHQQK